METYVLYVSIYFVLVSVLDYFKYGNEICSQFFCSFFCAYAKLLISFSSLLEKDVIELFGPFKLAPLFLYKICC